MVSSTPCLIERGFFRDNLAKPQLARCLLALPRALTQQQLVHIMLHLSSYTHVTPFLIHTVMRVVPFVFYGVYICQDEVNVRFMSNMLHLLVRCAVNTSASSVSMACKAVEEFIHVLPGTPSKPSAVFKVFYACGVILVVLRVKDTLGPQN